MTVFVAVLACLDGVLAALAAARWLRLRGWQDRFECWFWGAPDPGLPAPPDYGVPAYLAAPVPAVLAGMLAVAWAGPAVYGLLSTAAALGAAHALLSRAGNRVRAIESTRPGGK